MRVMLTCISNIKGIVIDKRAPERGKGDGLWPFVSPFSLLLSEDEELGLDEEALLENGLVLQSANVKKVPLMLSETCFMRNSQYYVL